MLISCRQPCYAVDLTDCSSLATKATNRPNIHAQHDRKLAKFWLDPVRLAASTDFGAHELNRLRRVVEENEPLLLEAWNDYFSS